jgi:hypothetical protein
MRGRPSSGVGTTTAIRQPTKRKADKGHPRITALMSCGQLREHMKRPDPFEPGRECSKEAGTQVAPALSVAYKAEG